MFQNPPDDVIREILAHPRRIAVIGCSPDPHRDSHRVAAALMGWGHHIFPVNPAAGEVLGMPCYPALADVPPPVDMVDIFRRSDAAGAVVDEAVRIGAGTVWMQLGVIDEDAAVRAQLSGLTVVMDRCPLIEHRRLF
jgi:predicted CoA-binding protein